MAKAKRAGETIAMGSAFPLTLPYEAHPRLTYADTSQSLATSTTMAMLARAHQRIPTGSIIAFAHWSRRATNALKTLRMGFEVLDPAGPTLLQRDREAELWTFAGDHTNQYLTGLLHLAFIEKSAPARLYDEAPRANLSDDLHVVTVGD